MYVLWNLAPSSLYYHRVHLLYIVIITLLLPLLCVFTPASRIVKGYGVATLAQNKIFPAKQERLLSEITGLPLDVQVQRNRLDVDERVEGSRQCSCSRPS
jgi:hypothetical protein